MFHSVTKRGSKRYRYYVCAKALKNGRSTCRTKSLPAAEIEAVVVDQIRCIARDSGLRDEVLRQARKDVEANICELTTQRQQLECQLGRDQAEIRRLVEVDRPSSATTARIAELHERISRAEQELTRVRNRLEDTERQQITQSDVTAAFADFDGVWNALSSREQVKVLHLLVARVEFDATDSTIAITFHPSAIKTLSETSIEDAA
jgi:site-specific DNA recombinase